MASRSSRSRWISTALTCKWPTSWIRWPIASTAVTRSSTPTARRARKSSSSTRGWRSSARFRCCRPALARPSEARPRRRCAVASGAATGWKCPCTGWTRSPSGRRSRARRSSSRRRPRCSCARASGSPSHRTAGSTSASAERVSRDLRHNMAALGADYALFGVGLSLASQSTILPAFAASLGAPNVVIGAIPAVMTLGWFLPSLFAAGHTETLARKLPFVLRYSVWERVPFAVLALAAFFLADRAPALPLALRLLGRDPNLAWFLAARAFAVIGSMAGGFYTVHAIRAWDAPAAQAGVFTTLLFLGQMAGNAVFGWLADRRGHLLVIMMGLAATLAGNLVAITSPTLGAFGVVFVMMGAQIAAMNVSTLNVMLEFAPVLEERPTYIGLGTTLMAPIAFGAPLAAGLLADAFGFTSVFAAAALAASVALGLLLTRVRDPRGAASPRPA